MITAIFLVYFLKTGSVQVLAEQKVFTTMEECNLYAEQVKEEQQQKVLEGISTPHKAIHKCVDWGEST